MARVTYVKKAQQRYHTKPVRNEDGSQKQTPVMKTVREYVYDENDKRVLDENGKPVVKVTEVQKTTKTGRPVFLRITEDDKDRPKPNYKCEKCGAEIKVGDPYKHVTVKSSYGGTKHVRCNTCPTWQPWDLSNSLSARLQQISHNFSTAVMEANEPSDIESALTEAAEEVRSIAEEKRESASNIEEGFQHSTYQSDELNQVADDLDSWADEIDNASSDIPELPEVETVFYVHHNGDLDGENFEVDGYETAEDAQSDLDAYIAAQAEAGEEVDESEYSVDEEERDELTEDQLSEWRDEAESALSIVDESPV